MLILIYSQHLYMPKINRYVLVEFPADTTYFDLKNKNL